MIFPPSIRFALCLDYVSDTKGLMEALVTVGLPVLPLWNFKFAKSGIRRLLLPGLTSHNSIVVRITCIAYALGFQL